MTDPVPALKKFKLSSAPLISLYCDGSFSCTGNRRAAGYGVYVNSELHKVTVCEPVLKNIDNSQRAEVMALLSAIEIAHALRLKKAEIINDSKSAVSAYNNSLNTWKSNKWMNAHGKRVPNHDLWVQIAMYKTKIAERKLNLIIRWMPRNSCEGQVFADQLAKQACKLSSYILEGVKKKSEANMTPSTEKRTCNDGSCNGRVFVDEEAYCQHQKACHLDLKKDLELLCNKEMQSCNEGICQRRNFLDGKEYEEHTRVCPSVVGNEAKRINTEGSRTCSIGQCIGRKFVNQDACAQHKIACHANKSSYHIGKRRVSELICNEGKCNGRKFVDSAAYAQHNLACHLDMKQKKGIAKSGSKDEMNQRNQDDKFNRVVLKGRGSPNGSINQIISEIVDEIYLPEKLCRKLSLEEPKKTVFISNDVPQHENDHNNRDLLNESNLVKEKDISNSRNQSNGIPSVPEKSYHCENLNERKDLTTFVFLLFSLINLP